MKCNEMNYVKRLKSGKEDALDYVIRKYLPLVKGAIFKILMPLKDDGIIEECINDVFLSIWNNSNKFHGKNEDFKKWVYVIAKFKAIDYYRSAVKRCEAIMDSIDIYNANSAEEDFISIEDRNNVLKLINDMEPVDREIFILKFFLGYKSIDIAKKLNITKASVDNRISRGKRKMREKASGLNLEVI
ncbi:MAG: sigma-70 family RNA polymerase sigma factor [Bacillota bacterium]|nr:sigma-70 family RNA polymerase sigma factor [Bacillota bacterium]